MKIRSRMIILNIIFLVGIVGATLVLLYSQNLQQRINQTALYGVEAKSALHRSNSLAKELLITSTFHEVYPKFQEQYQNLQQAIDRFTSTDEFQKLLLIDKKGQERYKGLKNINRYLNDKVKEVNEEIEVLTERYPTYLPGLLAAYRYYSDVDINIASSDVTNLTIYLGDSFERTLTDLISFLQERAVMHQKQVMFFSYSMVAVFLMIVLLVSIGIMRSLREQLSGLQQSMEVLSEGDFSRRLVVQGKDELSSLADSMNRFIDDFSSVIDDVKIISEESNALKDEVNSATNESSASVHQMSANITSISQQIDKLVQDLSISDQSTSKVADQISQLVRQIEDQASSVTQSSSSIEEMTASIESISTILKNRQEASSKLEQITMQGGEQVEETNRLIEENGADVKEILEVISIINNVASQTNLLSMNAAIEAAHAGDAGRGFAVVAEEIRKLAESTNENSKRIRKTITTIADRIQTITEASTENRNSYRLIETETKNNSQAMSEIASTMRELSQGSSEIMKAMTNLSTISQEIQESAEEMDSHTDEVSSAISRITSIGDQVRDGMNEIDAGAKDISAAMANVNELNDRSSSSIEKLHSEVKRFKTSCDLDEEESIAVHGDMERVCVDNT